jgi:hypothetical protein
VYHCQAVQHMGRGLNARAAPILLAPYCTSPRQGSLILQSQVILFLESPGSSIHPVPKGIREEIPGQDSARESRGDNLVTMSQPGKALTHTRRSINMARCPTASPFEY